jgi:hypothetical protein
MLHDNTRWSRVSEQNSADGVLWRHRELSMRQLLGAPRFGIYGPAISDDTSLKPRRGTRSKNRSCHWFRHLSGASRCGAWDLNTDRRMLRFPPSEQVTLGSRALEILIALASRPGQILSKEDLTKLV